MLALASAWMHLQIPEHHVGIWSLQVVGAVRRPTQTVGEEKTGHGGPVFEHFSPRAQRAS